MQVAIWAKLEFHGESIPVDNMNRTYLSINGEGVERRPPQEGEGGRSVFDLAGYVDIPEIQVGDVVELSIPSGDLSIVAEETHNGDHGPVVAGRGDWTGSYGGLIGGLSGLAWFEAGLYGKVKTSAYPRRVAADIYEATHRVADEVRYALGVRDPEFKRALMRSLINFHWDRLDNLSQEDIEAIAERLPSLGDLLSRSEPPIETDAVEESSATAESEEDLLGVQTLAKIRAAKEA